MAAKCRCIGTAAIENVGSGAFHYANVRQTFILFSCFRTPCGGPSPAGALANVCERCSEVAHGETKMVKDVVKPSNVSRILLCSLFFLDSVTKPKDHDAQ